MPKATPDPIPDDTPEHAQFTPLNVGRDKAGAVIDVIRKGGSIPTTARIDAYGFVRTTALDALVDADLFEVKQDLDRVEGIEKRIHHLDGSVEHCNPEAHAE